MITGVGLAGSVVVNLLAPAIVLVCVPGLVLEWIVLPLRLPRTAYWVAKICMPLSFAEETTSGGIVYGALAVRNGSSAKTIDWLGQRLRRTRSLRGGGVVAAGLLAALRGDRHQARCLFLVADTMVSKNISRKARSVARDWLVADAAQVGNWQEVIRLGRRGTRSLRWSYALARIAERLVGDHRAGHDGLLWFIWILAPRRRATFPLLRRALAAPRAPKEPPLGQSGTATLPDALADFADLFKSSQTHDALSLALSVCKVDTALDSSGTRSQIQQRLLALDARHDVEAVIDGFRSRLIDLLTALIEGSPHLAGGQQREPIIEQAIARMRLRLFKDIKAQCKDYTEREKSQRALDAPVEWQMWAVLRNSADRLLKLDPSSESALFQTMYVPVANFAVFQHNIQKSWAFSYEIFCWLHERSRSDPAALQLLAGNMRAALG